MTRRVYNNAELSMPGSGFFKSIFLRGDHALRMTSFPLSSPCLPKLQHLARDFRFDFYVMRYFLRITLSPYLPIFGLIGKANFLMEDMCEYCRRDTLAKTAVGVIMFVLA